MSKSIKLIFKKGIMTPFDNRFSPSNFLVVGH